MWVRPLASPSRLRIWHCYGHCCSPAATAPIGPLAWEPPYAEGVALKRQKDQKKKTPELNPAPGLKQISAAFITAFLSLPPCSFLQTEWEALELTDHQWALDDVEEELMAKDLHFEGMFKKELQTSIF